MQGSHAEEDSAHSRGAPVQRLPHRALGGCSDSHPPGQLPCGRPGAGAVWRPAPLLVSLLTHPCISLHVWLLLMQLTESDVLSLQCQACRHK